MPHNISIIRAAGLQVTSKTANYTAAAGDYVLADASGGSFTVSLPASPSTNDIVAVYATSVGTSTNTVTISGNSNDINGSASSLVLYVANDFVELIFDGAEWWTIGKNIQRHHAQMYRSTAQTISSTTETIITGLTIEADVGALANTITSRMTVRRAGSYLVTVMGSIGSVLDAGEFMQLRVVVNGGLSRYNQTLSTATNQAVLNPLAVTVELAAGDYVQMAMYHNEGANQDTSTNSIDRPTFSVQELP